MVRMRMGVENGIKVPDGVCKKRQPHFRRRVNKNIRAVLCCNKNGWAQALVARVWGHADRAVAANHRYAVRGAAAENSNFHAFHCTRTDCTRLRVFSALSLAKKEKDMARYASIVFAGLMLLIGTNGCGSKQIVTAPQQNSVDVQQAQAQKAITEAQNSQADAEKLAAIAEKDEAKAKKDVAIESAAVAALQKDKGNPQKVVQAQQARAQSDKDIAQVDKDGAQVEASSNKAHTALRQAEVATNKVRTALNASENKH